MDSHAVEVHPKPFNAILNVVVSSFSVPFRRYTNYFATASPNPENNNLESLACVGGRISNKYKIGSGCGTKYGICKCRGCLKKDHQFSQRRYWNWVRCKGRGKSLGRCPNIHKSGYNC